MTTVFPCAAEPSRPDAGAVRATVAVPTFRRTDRLRGLLPLLLAQAEEVAVATAGRFLVDVLVVDNDPRRSAAAVVQACGSPDVRYVAETVPGIAAVRNRALDEAVSARLLAFIDDDERPASGWLLALLTTWTSTGAAAVAGPVHAEYGGDLDPWIRAGGFFDARDVRSGTEVAVAATGNLLLDLAEIRRLGIRFDTALGLGGGEDNLFTRSLGRAGGRIVWCSESAAVEYVPAERMTRAWVRARSWSHGNTAVLTELRLTASRAARSAIRVRWAAGGTLRVVAGAARWALGVISRSARWRASGVRVLLRGGGMLAGSCGIVYVEYARNGRTWRISRELRR